jgi:hypothetical protein
LDSFQDDEFIDRIPIRIPVVTKASEFAGYVDGDIENIIRVPLFLLQRLETL